MEDLRERARKIALTLNNAQPGLASIEQALFQTLELLEALAERLEARDDTDKIVRRLLED